MPPQSDWTSADLLGDLLAACYRRLLVQAAIEETPITDESLGGDGETGASGNDLQKPLTDGDCIRWN
jgi:hypothetical protein